MKQEIRVLLAEDTKDGQSALRSALLGRQDVMLLPHAQNGTRAIEYLQLYRVDLFIVDLLLSEMDGLGVLSELKRMNLSSPPKVVVISAMSNEFVIAQASQLGAIYCMLRPCEPKQLVERAVEVYQKSCEEVAMVKQLPFVKGDIRSLAVEVLREVGVPPQLSGYEYLQAALLFSLQNTSIVHCLTTCLYPEVAKQYNATPQRVERAIRHAIEATWNRGNVDKLNSMFGYSVADDRGRPTNAEFIARLKDLISMRCAQ